MAARFVVREAPPFHAAATRYVVSTVLLQAILAWKAWGPRGSGRFPVPPSPGGWLHLLALGAVGIALYNVAFFTGLRQTTAANASLIVAINPLLTAALSALWLGEPFRPGQGAGFLLSLAGVAFVVSDGSWEALRNLSFNRGDLLLLLAPLTWAVYSVHGKRVLAWCSPLEATAHASLFGTLLLLPMAAAEGGSMRIGAWGWIAILQLAVLGTVVGFVWWYEGVRAIGAGRSALFVNLVPLFGILMAAAFLGEAIRWPHLAGGILVVGGVVLGTLSAREPADSGAPRE